MHTRVGGGYSCWEAELPPISSVITKLRRQDPYIQQVQHRYRSPGAFSTGPITWPLQK